MDSDEFITSTSGRGKTLQRSSPLESMHYFKNVVQEAGIKLYFDGRPNVLTQEQSLVIRDIEKILKMEVYPNKIQKFISGFKAVCKQDEAFEKLLSPTILRKIASTEESSQSKINQESVFRIFLNVSSLQENIIEILLEEITTQAAEESTGTSLLRLLLNAMRYLPFIAEPDVLTKKLLDILEISTFEPQLEILSYIPEIIPDCHYDETAKQLSKLLGENIDLTGAIIDCLNSLNLTSDTRTDVQEFILFRLSSAASSKSYFPVLFEFLITDCKSQQLPYLLLKVRDALETIMNNEVLDKNTESYKVIICNKIHSTSAVKIIYDGWVNIITNNRNFNSDQKPIDLLILFMLHSSGNNRKKQIDVLFRKKVKMAMFKTSHLETMFQKIVVRQILHNHLPSIIEIASNLLRNNEGTCNEFASVIYKLVFTNPHVDYTQRQDLLHSLMLLTGSSEMKTVYPILNILNELSSDPKLQQHTVQLMGLLEKLDSFDLHDVRQVFELLCTLTCGENADDAMSSLKDEIHMLIRKQLSSGKKVIKQRGIISCVVMAKHVGTTSEDQNELNLSDVSITNITDLPRGAPQDSACLLELARTCSSGTPELLGLYYDQLANIITYADNMDRFFTTWLFESVTQDFQDVFVVEKLPAESINDIELRTLFSLNSAEEVDISININIAGLTLQPTNNSIVVLAPLFRLLRLLHSKHYNGDLATIDALLGCGIFMPNLDDISVYDYDQIKQVSDCIFHCINWFRETISAFVTQTTKKLRLKVIERLNQLIELEKLLIKSMEQSPEHKLPTCYFQNISSASTKSSSPTKTEAKGRPKKKFKSSHVVINLNETATTSATVSTQVTKQSPVRKVTSDPIYNFREIDTDIIILLKYPLNINETESMTTTQQTKIEISVLQFILKDFISKLKFLSNNKNVRSSNLIIKPVSLITDCTKLLPTINRHLLLITDKIKQILEETNGQLDHAGLYTRDAQSLKISFGLILECLSMIFDWSGFRQPKHLSLLKDCLKSLRNESQSQLHSANQLSKEFLNTLYGYTDYCLYLQPAVSLIKTMQSLSSINANNSDLNKKIASTSGKLLTKKWYNLNGTRDTGKQAFENIDTLLKAYLSGASVKTICGFVATLQTEANGLKSKDDYLPMLGSIDKQSFHIFYRCLCSFLLERVKTEVSSLTNNEHLVLWRTTALTMQGLMTVVKAQEIRSNLCIFLKKSIGILKVFLTHGIPILEIMLRTKTDEVVEILKTMQTSTRFLHHLCCYSKLTKDASLMASVPQFRLTLETFVFRVKAALVANNCSSAFWLGTLRNRDLQGEDIISQSTVTSEENVANGNSDEELPADDEDDDDDEDVVNTTAARDEDTASEIFD